MRNGQDRSLLSCYKITVYLVGNRPARSVCWVTDGSGRAMYKCKENVIARSGATRQSPMVDFSAQIVFSLEIPTLRSE